MDSSQIVILTKLFEHKEPLTKAEIDSPAMKRLHHKGFVNWNYRSATEGFTISITGIEFLTKVFKLANA